MRPSTEHILAALDATVMWRFHVPVLAAIAALLIFPPRVPDDALAAAVSVLIVLAGVGVGLAWQWSAIRRKRKV
ncbi:MULTISPECIES: hypothetical protein [unclassified Lysobacter]|uniref:hypothetical protein n=1 Tax=unclassified Lysobacter TaxID=2635362 RepID=UPI0006FC3310|nr:MULTISPECIES: hypothetical protein [unclassified Lysobacter]KRA19974.1 hypothetical protein ASD69_01040 [Lysobacter sp. Root604]SFK80718.1 hypothetical protein SAMN04487938_2111 [Lysobacter sp. cf310]